MSRSKHNGCGKACGICRPWKRFRGNRKKFVKPSDLKKKQDDFN